MNVCNITFDLVEIAVSMVMLRALAEEGEPGDEAIDNHLHEDSTKVTRNTLIHRITNTLPPKY